MKERIKEVISAVFNVPVNIIDDRASPDTIESWDSLNHMNLVAALEEEFDVRLSDQEILEMQNFMLIISILKEHISL
nr:acyl carrier protein [Bacteroidota bacterium]